MFSLISLLKKLLSHEALVTGRVTAASNNQTQLVFINETNCSSDIGSFDFFPKQFFAKVISCFRSFSLNEYDLRILSSVYLIEMFDLRGKELKYAKELLLNFCRKSAQNIYEVAGHAWVELKL